MLFRTEIKPLFRLLLAILIALSSFAVGYLIGAREVTETNSPKAGGSDTIVDPGISLPEQISHLSGFQKILITYCSRELSSDDKIILGGVDVKYIPLKLASTNEKSIESITPQCVGDLGGVFLQFNLGGKVAYLYDSYSDIPPHGGLPDWGQFGKSVKQDKNQAVNLFINGETNIPSELYVQMRGEKTLELRNGSGDKVAVSYTVGLFPLNDKRLDPVIGEILRTVGKDGLSQDQESRIEQAVVDWINNKGAGSTDTYVTGKLTEIGDVLNSFQGATHKPGGGV